MHNRLDGILRLLDKNKDFYDGTATECPAVLLSELMAEDDPFVPFCESLAIHQVEPQEAQALRKQFDDIGQLSKQVFGRLSKRFNLSLDEEDKGNFSKFLTEYVKCSQPKGMTRHEWVWAFAYNSIISWIIFCYTIELNEENCLGKAMEDPKFRIETAEDRIALMNLHQRWDRRFRGARPDVRNCIDFFGSLLLRVSLLVADSRNFFDYDTGRGKGSCEEDIDTALTADTRHAPYNKLVPAVASHWIELARTRVISTLAATFHKRANACKDNPEAAKHWKDLYAMVCPQNDDLKLDYTPDEVSVIVRLAKLAADYSHDCQKAVEKYDNVLPLATIQHSEDLGVDVCDIRPLRDHPFKWRGAVAAWFERLKLKVIANPDSQAILDLIDRTSLAALEYYRVLSTRAPYLRGETNQLPPPFKDKNGKIFDVGQALTGSVANCLLSSMSKVIENLPALNTPDGGYPFDRLDEMFKAINLFTTMMNHCEEENTSVESDCFGQAVADTVLLHRLVCPKKNAQGRYVLERDLIAQAFGDFRKSILAAAWSVRRKAEKRASGKIDLCGDNSRFGYSGPGGATGELVKYEDMKVENGRVLNAEPVPPPPPEDPHALQRALQNSISDRRGAKYYLAQIEMDLLFRLPERSPWQFYRVAHLMEKTLFNAVADFDADLSQRTWFRQGLVILSETPYAHRARCDQDVSAIREYMGDVLADFTISLVKWCGCRKAADLFAVSKGDALTRAIETNFSKMPNDLERTKEVKKYLLKYLFFDDDGVLRYQGRPFVALLDACMGAARPSMSDVPEDVQNEVVKASVGFCESNDGGWRDWICDEWIEKTVVSIDLARQSIE